MMGRREGQFGLLNFKEADGGDWIDSKEGGVYAYLVVPMEYEFDTEEHDNLERCMVETSPSLRHAHIVSSSGHESPEKAEEDYWPDLYDFQENEWGISYTYKQSTPSPRNMEGKTPEEVRHMTTEYIYSYEGGPFYTVVYLGSSGPSVYNNNNTLERDTFWPIYTREDLTDEGKVLYDTLKNLYNIEPVILLFLDT